MNRSRKLAKKVVENRNKEILRIYLKKLYEKNGDLGKEFDDELSRRIHK